MYISKCIVAFTNLPINFFRNFGKWKYSKKKTASKTSASTSGGWKSKNTIPAADQTRNTWQTKTFNSSGLGLMAPPKPKRPR